MGPTMGKLWNTFSALSLVHGILYQNFEDEKHLQLCLPRKLVKEALESTHDIPSAGHLGSQRMAEVIKKRFYWSGWRSDVEAHCRNCQKCGAESPVRGALVLEHSGYSMEQVAIDVVRPLPNTTSGNRFILVAVDYFTRWPEAYAIRNQEAHAIAQKLVDEWVCRYGARQ